MLVPLPSATAARQPSLRCRRGLERCRSFQRAVTRRIAPPAAWASISKKTEEHCRHEVVQVEAWRAQRPEGNIGVACTATACRQWSGRCSFMLGARARPARPFSASVRPGAMVSGRVLLRGRIGSAGGCRPAPGQAAQRGRGQLAGGHRARLRHRGQRLPGLAGAPAQAARRRAPGFRCSAQVAVFLLHVDGHAARRGSQLPRRSAPAAGVCASSRPARIPRVLTRPAPDHHGDRPGVFGRARCAVKEAVASISGGIRSADSTLGHLEAAMARFHDARRWSGCTSGSGPGSGRSAPRKPRRR